MSIKSYLAVVDAPLAIVVGGVGVVLIALQLGAVGFLAQSQVDRAHDREASAREERIAQARCLGAAGAEAFSACRQSLVAAPSYDSTADNFAVR